MKIYRVMDSFHGEFKWFGDRGRANFQASLMATEFENEGFAKPEDYIEVEEINGKENLLRVLNGMYQR